MRDELAGRSGPCPTCKNTLTVPAVAAPKSVPTGQISGMPSSLHQAGLDVGVTIDSPRRTQGNEERSAVADLLAGRARTGGRYVVEKEIARGGMGAVVRAVDCDIRREVAVKYMLTDGDAAQKARFVEEAQITGQLEHPNIVPIHELGVDAERRLFFAMKMVRGRSLAQVLDDLRKKSATAEFTWSLGRLLNIYTNVCYALAYAHSRGVIHRDLKPANIMLGDFGETYVMDWGLAKVVARRESDSAPTAAPSEFTIRTDGGPAPTATSADGSGSHSSQVATSREVEGELTQDGAILGTPSYMSPEQARGDVQALDQRSDVYSLGAILYELLTLQSPVEKGGGAMALVMRVAEGQIKPPELRAPDRAKAGKIPKELSAVAMKALALKPGARYQTVEALRHDVERFQEGRSVSAKHDTPWESAVKFVRRNKAFSAATGVGVALLAVVLAVAFNVNYQARLRAESAQAQAEQNYIAFEAAQQAKNEAIRNSIPGTLRAARQLANDGAVDDALKQIALVRTYEPNNPQAALLRGQILTAQRNWPEAAKELAFYRRHSPSDPDTSTLFKLVITGKTDDLVLLYEAANVLQRQHLFRLTPLLLQDAAKLLEARKPLQALYDKEVKARFPGAYVSLQNNGELYAGFGSMGELVDVRELTGMQLNRINFGSCAKLADLEGLRGMPLTRLDLYRCRNVSSLEPLRGMPLTELTCQECPKISDIEPLRGMPLEVLNLNLTAVADFGPLAGMPLRRLDGGCPVSDLSPLKDMPLEYLWLSSQAIRDLEPLRGMPCTELRLTGQGITSLEPLRGMPCKKLSIYDCYNVESLEPLRGMPCVELNLYKGGKITDLEPLRGMPLQLLNLDGSGAKDLTPLADLPLRTITFNLGRIEKGLEALRGIKTLTQISPGGGLLSAAEFWKRYDAGEFTKK